MSGAEKSIEIPSKRISLDTRTIQKMVFVMNALDKGWSIKKREGAFIFSKKHEGKREVFMDNYLESFIESNFEMNVFGGSVDTNYL
jgi:phage pi2 protein 07